MIHQPKTRCLVCAGFIVWAMLGVSACAEPVMTDATVQQLEQQLKEIDQSLQKLAASSEKFKQELRKHYENTENFKNTEDFKQQVVAGINTSIAAYLKASGSCAAMQAELNKQQDMPDRILPFQRKGLDACLERAALNTSAIFKLIKLFSRLEDIDKNKSDPAEASPNVSIEHLEAEIRFWQSVMQEDSNTIEAPVSE